MRATEKMFIKYFLFLLLLTIHDDNIQRLRSYYNGARIDINVPIDFRIVIIILRVARYSVISTKTVSFATFDHGYSHFNNLMFSADYRPLLFVRRRRCPIHDLTNGGIIVAYV